MNHAAKVRAFYGATKHLSLHFVCIFVANCLQTFLMTYIFHFSTIHFFLTLLLRARIHPSRVPRPCGQTPSCRGGYARY